MLDAVGLPPQAPPQPGRPGIFSLSDASYVCAAMERAGLAEIVIRPYTLAFDHTSPEEWLDFLPALNVLLRQRLTGQPEDRVREARRAGVAAAAAYTAPDGHVRFVGHGYYAVATRSLESLGA